MAEDERKNEQQEDKRRSDRNIAGIVIFFIVLFMGMTVYFLYYLLADAPKRINSPYNARMDVFNDRYVRGQIISSDGVSLARTDSSGGGKESRVYPLGSLYAHSVGYSTKGKTGLEAAANFYLMNSHINPVTKLENEILETKSDGDNVITTLDNGLQTVAAKALGQKFGAVVCMDPRDGRVLAMVSNPGFDPNRVSEDWDALTSEENTAGNLLNRATQGLYPPGSTFKTLVALEFIREHPLDWQSFTFDCTGEYVSPENPDYVVHCYGGEVHGQETLQEAYANSCNSAFAEIGTMLDWDRLQKLAENMMFNEALPVQISSAKSRFKADGTSGTWTKMQSAIGQDVTLMSPIHNLMITAAVANGGVLQEPQLLERLENAEGREIKSLCENRKRTLMSDSEAEAFKVFMRSVVTDGTASKLITDAYEAAGKTGSAEYTEDGTVKTDCWFTGFAPYETPELAVTVLVEDGETGGRTAAPIAKALFDYWLTERNGG